MPRQVAHPRTFLPCLLVFDFNLCTCNLLGSQRTTQQPHDTPTERRLPGGSMRVAMRVPCMHGMHTVMADPSKLKLPRRVHPDQMFACPRLAAACVARCMVVSVRRESPPHPPPEPKGASFPGLPHPHPSQKGPSLPPLRLEMPSLGGCLPPSALIKGHAHLLLGASFWGMGQALPVDPSNAWPGGHPACVVHAIAASAAVIRRRQGAMMRGLAGFQQLWARTQLWGVLSASFRGDCFDVMKAS